MKSALNNKISNILTVFFLIYVFILTIGLIPYIYCSVIEVNPVFDEDISIDGNFADWNSINSYSINLKKNSTDSGLPVNLKCAQDYYYLYIEIDFEIEAGYTGIEEFLAILISSSEDFNNMTDAKIINMSYSQDETTFTDYYIENHTFFQDTHQDGDGLGVNNSITGNKNQIRYEFKIPLMENNEHDVNLRYENTYAFNISQGNNPLYPQGIIRSNDSVLITIINPTTGSTSSDDLSGFFSLIAAIVIFSIVGGAYGFYVFKIFLLQKKMERIKR